MPAEGISASPLTEVKAGRGICDMIGLYVLLATTMQTIHDAFGDTKYRPCPLLKEMVAAGYLGRKTRGVYRY